MRTALILLGGVGRLAPPLGRHQTIPRVKAEYRLPSPPTALILGEGVHLALPPVQREGACGVLYHVVQMWGRGGGRIESGPQTSKVESDSCPFGSVVE